MLVEMNRVTDAAKEHDFGAHLSSTEHHRVWLAMREARARISPLRLPLSFWLLRHVRYSFSLHAYYGIECGI